MPTPVQVKSFGSSSASSTAVLDSTNGGWATPAAGNGLILIIAGDLLSAPAVPSGWTDVGSWSDFDAGRVCYKPSAAGTESSISVPLGASAGYTIHGFELPGSVTLDGTPGIVSPGSGSSSTTQTTASTSPATTGDFGLAVWGTEPSTKTATGVAGSASTFGGLTNTAGSPGTISTVFGYATNGVSGAQTATATYVASPAPTHICSVIAFFTVAAAAPTVGPGGVAVAVHPGTGPTNIGRFFRSPRDTTAQLPTWGAAALSSAAAVTATGVTGTATDSALTVTDTITTAGTVGAATTAALPVTATVTVAGAIATSTAASLTETATITASGTVAAGTSAALTATASITASGTVATASTAALTVTSTITAGATPGGPAALAATATLTAVGATGLANTAALNTVATIAAAGNTGTAKTAALGATATIAAAGAVAGGGFTGTATLAVTARIVAGPTRDIRLVNVQVQPGRGSASVESDPGGLSVEGGP